MKRNLFMCYFFLLILTSSNCNDNVKQKDDTLILSKDIDSLQNFTVKKNYQGDIHDTTCEVFYSSNDSVVSEEDVKLFSLKIFNLIEETNDSDIVKIEKGNIINISGYGEVQFYKGTMNPDLPEVYDKIFFVFINRYNKHGFLLFLNTIETIQIRKNDASFLLAGRYKHRGYGYFKVFEFKNNCFVQKFISDIPVSNNSLDCKAYQNEDLKMFNIDINQDGLLDLVFKGEELNYCEGLEEGPNRKCCQPKSKKKMELRYLTQISNDSISWKKKE